ncbi:hypothetical protein HYDPIDRAFT_43812 [Hydnomerulius pinastri MD-312]|uniref:F-box domain-containing protein n=1 Tax=Hydnomerulius pinastri MD-312 TaxID=994086 RepID=A0A0C9W1K0_9AGAM|nr:hypothetical protein HYDPIDRAFT_43812 [Hydnomerulius pinastri MD-312]
MSCLTTDSENLADASNAIPFEIQRLMEVGANFVPTESQDQAIDSALRSLREQHAHLSAAEAQETPSAADPKIAVGKLKQLIARLASMRSPVRRVPPEVLGMVFELCVTRDSAARGAQGPLFLAHVCRNWREIAHSYPVLWTSLNFYFSDACGNREKDVTKVRPALDLWLKRSATLPISLTFTDHRIYHGATEDLIYLLVDRLRNNSRRWKSLSLQLSCGYFPLLFTFTPCDLASLEHLSINGDVLGQRIVTTLNLNLTSATKLKSLAYSGPGRSVDDRIHIDWDRLTYVSFEFSPHDGTSFTLSRQFRQLAQCQNVTTCSLGIGLPFRFAFGGQQTITLPCLETLRVRRLLPRSHASSAIDYLILPQLQTLEIDAAIFVSWNMKWHDRQFCNLLTRSACSLENLYIKDVDFPNEELLRCLANSHKLKSLSFIPCPLSQNILDIIEKLDISRPAGGLPMASPYLPQLQTLRLACTRVACFDGMLKMLTSRSGARASVAGVTNLECFELVFYKLWHETNPSTEFNLNRFRERLAQCTADDGKLDASLVIEAPYLPEYIEMPTVS